MIVSLRNVPLGCFFIDGYSRFCYKDKPTVGTDTNYKIIYLEFDLPSFGRGYCCDSSKMKCEIIDERFFTQLSLF